MPPGSSTRKATNWSPRLHEKRPLDWIDRRDAGIGVPGFTCKSSVFNTLSVFVAGAPPPRPIFQQERVARVNMLQCQGLPVIVMYLNIHDMTELLKPGSELEMNKFRLNASGCQPYTSISKFFATTPIEHWKDVDAFTKHVYEENPMTTAQEVFNNYTRSLSDITRVKDTPLAVAQCAQRLREDAVCGFYRYHVLRDGLQSENFVHK
ncbi:hypothetical protein BC936DRAFT_137215 [Jimgerdemannia flammicorona]|uniref:Uncharacterized protein n=1 Tax=Jimgerdemannia flammicorona TaxID=994334 RepID=A0A433CXU8_9FUNG|nr:hypothetical protein BC936DRAFT_137215 [Jimgerdemannia flammicorona]